MSPRVSRPWVYTALLALLLVGGGYANSLNNGFHFDDGHSIQDNVYLRDLSHLGDYFTEIRSFSPLAENRSYRPALLTGYALSHAVASGAPWGYHLGSLLLHAFGAWIIGLLCGRLLRAAGHEVFARYGAVVIATGIFALHPLLSETVNYVSARSSMQGAVFSFAAVLLYIQAREDGRRARFAASLATLALAMLSNLTALTVPALLVAWEVLLGPDRARLRAVSPKTWMQCILPYLAVAGGLTVLHESMVAASAGGARSQITPWSHLLTQTQVWMRFQALFIWPQDLCADLTMRWSESPLEGPTARAILLVLALVFASLSLFKKLPVSVFGLIWFYVTLSPTNSFVPLSEPATEHRVYIAMPGLIMVTLELGALAARSRARTWLLSAAAVATLIAMAAQTYSRNQVWKDSVSLWGSVLTCAPDNGRAHLNYGRGLLAQGDVQGALQSYQKCADLWPGYVFCPINQAALALSQKQYEEADRYAKRAMTLQPNNVYARHWQGMVHLALNRFDAAARAFESALEIAPGYPDAEQGLARTRFELGDLPAAAAGLRPFALEKTLNAGGWYAWGFLRQQAQDLPAALTAYSWALQLDPEHRRARYNRGLMHHRAGRLQQAVNDYRRLAKDLSPSPDLLFNLALAENGAGNERAARRARDRLKMHAPNYQGLARLDQTLGIQ